MSKKYFQIPLLLVPALLMVYVACSTAKQPRNLMSLSLTGEDEDRTTIVMYDNCPKETAARLAELALKSSMPHYDGTTVLSYTGKTPSLSDLQPVRDYYGYCEEIRDALMRGANRLCFLTFNTGKWGTDISLDLSNDEAIYDSLVTMAAYNKTAIYAIYSY